MKIISLLVALQFIQHVITAQLPAINSFSPLMGPPGTLITVQGSNLGSVTNLTVGGIAAIVVSDSATTLVGQVMPGTSTGTVSVTTAGGIAMSMGTFTVNTTTSPDFQQGNKLIGQGAIGASALGISVAISSDGNTTILGGNADNNGMGAVWVFIRSGGIWTQQGNKIVGTGVIDTSGQGISVAISADGNTAIVGGDADNYGTGAAWVFTRSGGVWTQQGSKLTGNDNSRFSGQGVSVSISSDGNTALVGGPYDNSAVGAVWVYARSGGVWTQQGSKLVGTGSIGSAEQGNSVSISSDGNTALVGGNGDNSGTGAVWVYTRIAGVWTQQGNKLVGIGVTGTAIQGNSVSISSDGNTAIVGGYGDNGGTGAVWVYTRSGGSWTQQGNKLVSAGATSQAQQGISVSVSSDGNTAIIGGSEDNNYSGAAWVYTRSGGVWTQQGNKLFGVGASGQSYQGNSVSISSDGNTAVVGGYNDNNNAGAVWIFVSNPEGIDNVLRNNQPFNVYPNPNTGEFTLQAANAGTYQIMDAIGKSIQSFKLNSINNNTLNIQNLGKGIYFIVGYFNNQISEQKVVVY